MRPIPIDDATLAQFPIGAIRRVWAGPSGDLTDEQIPPTEGASFYLPIAGYPNPQPVTVVVITLEDGDLDQLNAGGRIIMGWPGFGMPVFLSPWVQPEP